MEKERKKITEGGRMVVLAYYKQKKKKRWREEKGRRTERRWRAGVSGRAQTGRNIEEIKEEQ